MNNTQPPSPADEPVPAIDVEQLPGAGSAADAAGGFPEIAALIAALRLPAHPHELTGELNARAAFSAAIAAPPLKEISVPKPHRHLRRIANPRAGAKAAAAAVVGALALGGVAAAATGTLPGQSNNVAATLSAASDSVSSTASTSATGSASSTASATATDSASSTASATATDSASNTPSTVAGSLATASPSSVGVGPDALGPAAFGLCHAFGNKTSNPSVAYRNVAAAAASKGLTVNAFCAVVLANHGVPSPWPTSTASSSTASSSTPPIVGPTQGPGHGNQH
jgi:hypothetical protein